MPASGSPRARRTPYWAIAGSCWPIWETTMLRLEGVSVAYGKHEALHEVSLSVTAGETTAILGTNGAGKTTMLNAIVGLVRPRPGGRILFEGRPIESEPTRQAEISYAVFCLK